jgi:nicotinate-nucleotide pyrophosphorylase (carboxylating)
MALVEQALAEDLGGGDVTSNAVIAADATGEAVVEARQVLVACGLPIAEAVFACVDPSLELVREWGEGEARERDLPLLRVRGNLRSILAAERTALNFLQRLSGIATGTRRCVDALAAGGGRTRLLDTRKTTPGWRTLEKAAVRAGGGKNHRASLGDGILVKDNHVAACGGVAEAVRRARAGAGALLRVEVEVVDLPGLDEAVAAGADIVLLDNMDDATMAAAVKRAAGRVLLEASGNMTLERLPRVAATGVDFVSMGAITHSARAVDLSFELLPHGR